MASPDGNQEGHKALTRLPLELLESVLSHLPNRDIKNVRLTCTHLRNVAHLRLDRVFLSANPRNIQVFKAIANHHTFSQHIVEIIYDDARLPHSLETEDDIEFGDMDDPPPAGVPGWYARIYRENLERIKDYKGEFVERPDHIEVAKQLEARLSPEQSYKHYQKLVKQQEKVVAADDDAKALRYGLQRFPNLRRITLTPIAHGLPFIPWYETPMIRDLPYGLIYPIPRGWPMTSEHSNRPFADPWDNEEEKNKWRGFRLIVRTLAQHQHHITDFVVEVNQLLTGLSCRIFDEPNQEYNDLVTLFRRPNFSRIDLALFIGGQEYEAWHSFRSTYLRRALGEAKDLQHVSLSTGLQPPQSAVDPEFYGTDGTENFIPLRTIFPVDQWKQLRHFGLSRFIVKQEDLVGLLSALPPTLRSVDLSFLFFLKCGGDYRGLLRDMRNKLGWRERSASERPKVIIHLEMHPRVAGLSVDISRETEDFVYHDGANPFGEDESRRGIRVFRGEGFGTERDAFQPANDRPYVHETELMDLGIFEKSDWYLRGFRF